MPRSTTPLTLREAYERYDGGKGSLGRSDLFGLIVDAIEDINTRLAGVDPAAVADIRNRVGSLETTIGNALRSGPAPALATMGGNNKPRQPGMGASNG